jgi:hypothetical protein
MLPVMPWYITLIGTASRTELKPRRRGFALLFAASASLIRNWRLSLLDAPRCRARARA